MTNKTETQFFTVPGMNSAKANPSFFSPEYSFGGKEKAKDFPTEGIAEVSCQTPDCKFAIRAQKEAAERFFEMIGQKGCPLCGKSQFAIFRVTSL